MCFFKGAFWVIPMFSALCPTSLRLLFPRVCANSTSGLPGSTGSEGDWATCSLCEEANSLGQRVGVTVCEWNQLCGIWGWSGGDTLVLRPPDLCVTLKGPAASSVLSLGPPFGYFGPASRPLAVCPRSLCSLHELEPDANQAHVWC